jgi:hypothetical protein
LKYGFSSIKRDFLPPLKIFPKPLARASKGEERPSKAEEKILEGANPYFKTRVLYLAIPLANSVEEKNMETCKCNFELLSRSVGGSSSKYIQEKYENIPCEQAINFLKGLTRANFPRGNVQNAVPPHIIASYKIQKGGAFYSVINYEPVEKVAGKIELFMQGARLPSFCNEMQFRGFSRRTAGSPPRKKMSQQS